MEGERLPPRIRPEESSQRAVQISVDMCVMNTQYMNTLSQFLSDGELFHVQMNLLYGLIDTMGATAGIHPQAVLDIAGKYFKGLIRERHQIERLGP